MREKTPKIKSLGAKATSNKVRQMPAHARKSPYPLASALASMVLPQPGGPKRRTPGGLVIPSCAHSSGRCRGYVMASSSSLWEGKQAGDDENKTARYLHGNASFVKAKPVEADMRRTAGAGPKRPRLPTSLRGSWQSLRAWLKVGHYRRGDDKRGRGIRCTRRKGASRTEAGTLRCVICISEPPTASAQQKSHPS